MGKPQTSDDKAKQGVRATRPEDKAITDRGLGGSKKSAGKRDEPPKSPPPKVDLRLILYLYPDVATDASEQELKNRAIEWVKEDPLHRASMPIRSLAEAFTVLDVISKEIGRRTKSKDVGPFISELHLLGHGNPGKFEIGNYMYDAEYLKKLDKGKAEKYLLPNAKIYLVGCLAAKGPEGKEFLYQIGRVFLGKKHGFIQGNTSEVIAYGHMVTKDHVRLEYPQNVVVPATD